MGERIQLRAQDGFTVGAWRAAAAGARRGGLVVVQEIFGVNQHIREVCEGFAQAGYLAVAPQIFDRVERDLELGYEGEDIQRGADIAMNQLDHERMLADVQAAVEAAAAAGRVGVVGYCFGGLVAWLTACNLRGVDAACCYYGGGIARYLQLTPSCPVMMHFGERDAHIPMEQVEQIRAAHPEAEIHTYDADHGFNCDHRGSYDPESAALARERTLEFFGRHLAV